MNAKANAKLSEPLQEIETPKPVLQIGNVLFQGAFEPFLGTAVCFQQTDQNKPTTSENNGDRRSTDLKVLSKCDLKLPMKRVYLERKKGEEETEPESQENPEEIELEVRENQGVTEPEANQEVTGLKIRENREETEPEARKNQETAPEIQENSEARVDRG